MARYGDGGRRRPGLRSGMRHFPPAVCLALLAALAMACGTVWPAEPVPRSSRAAARILAPGEKLRYAVSWSGGIGIGTLELALEPGDGRACCRILARVRDHGLFRLFYPVDDTFVTLMDATTGLPVDYRVVQVEGHAGKTTRRRTRFDQDRFEAWYRKNTQPPLRVDTAGPVHNEFTAFYATRTAPMRPGARFVVPTFADRRRHLVEVQVADGGALDTRFGRVRVWRVLPRMPFKGLYDKTGDTVLYLSADDCRVPVRIESKIAVGSLRADLVAYENSRCPSDYWAGPESAGGPDSRQGE